LTAAHRHAPAARRDDRLRLGRRQLARHQPGLVGVVDDEVVVEFLGQLDHVAHLFDARRRDPQRDLLFDQPREVVRPAAAATAATSAADFQTAGGDAGGQGELHVAVERVERIHEARPVAAPAPAATPTTAATTAAGAHADAGHVDGHVARRDDLARGVDDRGV